ncbi:MAG: hypothetical protein P4L50_22910 [Anaerolineaceae bacterium]|nr:hypothetical protein [Anaerolineaceae bacterium]
MKKRDVYFSFVGLVILGLILLAGSAQVPPGINPNVRVGFGASSYADVPAWAHRLGANWYVNWSVVQAIKGSYPEIWQMVRSTHNGGLEPSQQLITLAARNDPGAVWIIGNEPDNIWQDSLTPEAYAHFYHDTYALIKSADPSARIAVGGISQATPIRLSYLDQVLADYRKDFGSSLPADWWTLHGYVLQEKHGSWGVDIPPGFSNQTGTLYTISDHGSVSLFETQIRAFRIWMAKNGYRNKPLALTEFGILLPQDFGYTPAVISTYLTTTFSWLDTASDNQTGYAQDLNHLVQKWAWFSLSDPTYSVPDLVDLKSETLTMTGSAYSEWTKSHKN